MRRAIAMLAIAALAATLVACGGGSGKNTQSTPGSTSSAPRSTTAPRGVVATPAAPASRTTFHVLAGTTDGVFDIEQFMPSTIHIRAGDSITWTAKGFEGHTVTFFPDGRLNIGQSEYLVPAPDMPGAREFNPVYALGSDAQGTYDGTQYINSGFMGVPAEGTYTLAFPTQGTYSYLCMIHPLNMRGQIVVDPAGTQVPSPESVSAEGEVQLQQHIQESRDTATAARAERDAQNSAAGGSVWQVSVGLDTPHGQVLSFTPGKLDIDIGDKVVFWNSDRDFHNVVFAPQGTSPAPFPIIKPVEGKLGFRLIINPESEREFAAPTDAFGPDASASSGIMGIGFPRFYYEQVFTKPGTYTYYCTIHVLAGMAGTITAK